MRHASAHCGNRLFFRSSGFQKHWALPSLCRYETGETEPSAAVLMKYADFFDVSMDYIFGRTDDPHGAAPVRKSVDEPELEQFIEMCFDPKSSANARLKETLKQMMREAKE